MRFKISTAHGDFYVFLSYSPSHDDSILNRFADVINKASVLHQRRVLDEHPELSLENDFDKVSNLIIDSLDEEQIEKDLYKTTVAANGAGLRVKFSKKNREIHVDRW